LQIKAFVPVRPLKIAETFVFLLKAKQKKTGADTRSRHQEQTPGAK